MNKDLYLFLDIFSLRLLIGQHSFLVCALVCICIHANLSKLAYSSNISQNLDNFWCSVIMLWLIMAILSDLQYMNAGHLVLPIYKGLGQRSMSVNYWLLDSRSSQEDTNILWPKKRIYIGIFFLPSRKLAYQVLVTIYFSLCCKNCVIQDSHYFDLH